MKAQETKTHTHTHTAVATGEVESAKTVCGVQMESSDFKCEE